MMKREWGDRQRPTPKDAVTTATSIMWLIGHPRYITWCSEQESIQEFWRQPERIVEHLGVPILTSNINAGDFFNHGTGVTQIGVVSQKITLIGKPNYIEGLRDSIHPTFPQYLKYSCAGEMGGFGDLWHDHGMGGITSGYFVWLPLPFQLIMGGFLEEAYELNTLIHEITNELLSVNTETEQVEGFEDITPEEADRRNKQLKEKGEPQRWVPVREEDEDHDNY
ncbi:MAG TPA: hypothetical protein V6C65_24605 [Allocoleopsis sp.]